MSKKSRDIELFVVDIFVSLYKIKDYTQVFKNADDFNHSSLHWDATIRQLEIIGESLNYLLEDEQFSTYAPRYFRKIVNFRNVIIHGYFGIDIDEVWDVITIKLIALFEDMVEIIKYIDISHALEIEIKNYLNTGEKELVAYLKTLVGLDK